MKKLFFLILSHLISQQGFSVELTTEQYLERFLLSSIDINLAKEVGIRLPSPMTSLIQMKDVSGGTADAFEFNQQIPFPTKVT